MDKNIKYITLNGINFDLSKILQSYGTLENFEELATKRGHDYKIHRSNDKNKKQWTIFNFLKKLYAKNKNAIRSRN